MGYLDNVKLKKMKKARKRYGVIANFYNNYSRLCELFGGSWYAYVSGKFV